MKAGSKKAGKPATKRASAAAAVEWTEEQKKQISALAYHHFLGRGGQHEFHMQDWLRAEAELAKVWKKTKPGRSRTGKT